FLFFFFQAEDGIRDRTVTGVQTCALPILPQAPAGVTAPGYSCSVRNFHMKRRTDMEVSTTAEHRRLNEDASRTKNWKRWGPYLSERQWATVREDYSPYGNCWDYFPHDHARSRAYRWGEDGLLGITD